jgi:hypothetical protein
MKHTQIRSMADVMARPSDFVVVHKNIEQFTKDYDLDANVFG